MIHHLSCATLRPVGSLGGRMAPPEVVAHCLLVERPGGLVLVDTGFGSDDVAAPRRLGRPFVAAMRPTLDPAATAASQVVGLGHRIEDVTDIVLTHLDLDHAGGLADFPHARVHVHAAELDAALHPRLRERMRYVGAQWAHGPKWVAHQDVGEDWFGLGAVRALQEDVLLVPLRGHTRGHCAVAVRRPDDGWLLHAGDAYFDAGELSDPPRVKPALSGFQRLMAVDNVDRLENQQRLRELHAAHGGQVTVFSAHDPDEFARLGGTGPVGSEGPLPRTGTARARDRSDRRRPRSRRRRIGGTGSGTMPPVRTLGVEEELMLVDPATGMVTGVASRALRAHEEAAGPGSPAPPGAAPVEAELFTQQIETQTPPCAGLDELAAELKRGRRSTCEAAAAAGAAAVAIAAPALVDSDTEVTRQPRYERIREEYGELARLSLACATHVHVSLGDDEDGVATLDGLAPWLPLLLAVSANSPYADGRDTGYASWRAQIWTRWPSHGTGERFGDLDSYRRVEKLLTEWGAGLDDGMVYFDARLSRTYPTLEVRVADVTTELEDTVLVAALARALVDTYATGADRPAGWRSDLLRAATWRASRYGIAGRLVDPVRMELVSAREALGSLVARVRPALQDAGDLDVVESLIERLLARGNGAIQQRRAFEAGDGVPAVVADCARRTEASWREHGTWLAD